MAAYSTTGEIARSEIVAKLQVCIDEAELGWSLESIKNLMYDYSIEATYWGSGWLVGSESSPNVNFRFEIHRNPSPIDGDTVLLRVFEGPEYSFRVYGEAPSYRAQVDTLQA